MIKFQEGNNQFNFRSVALIIKENHVLIQKDLKDDFWALPGGRVEFFENSSDTVVREIFEELGWKVQLVRPVWFIENFFQIGITNFHETATLYLMEILGNTEYQSNIEFRGLEDHLIFKWADISKLNEINLKPKELKSKLKNLPSQVEFLSLDHN
ncbi:MAG: NUDIX hydrolase [Roseivirga sp.]|nr:NUDIX hydrolase [Roseivirga sp.]